MKDSVEELLERHSNFATIMFRSLLIGIETNKNVKGWDKSASDAAERVFTAALADDRAFLQSLSNRVIKAAAALIADVRRRNPGEELYCPYMIELDAALQSTQTKRPHDLMTKMISDDPMIGSE